MYAYITGKSIKQRIYICIALTAIITLVVFTVKVNLFDSRTVSEQSQTSVSESAESAAENGTTNSTSENYEPPQFHISLIDVVVLLAVIAAYSIHKIREKIRHRRM